MTLDLLRSSRRLGGGAPRLTEARRAVDQAALTELEGGGRPPALQTWASFEESRNCSSMEDSLPVAEEWPCLAMSGGADRHGLGCSCVSGPGSVPAFSSSALYFGDGFVFVLCDTLVLCQISCQKWWVKRSASETNDFSTATCYPTPVPCSMSPNRACSYKGVTQSFR